MHAPPGKDALRPATHIVALALRAAGAGTHGSNGLDTKTRTDQRTTDRGRRELHAEIARVPRSGTTVGDSGGTAGAIPTNISDCTVTYDGWEAVGPLNEMGILATLSANPLVLIPNPNTYPTRDTTVDLTLYDILVNYLTFAVISKPSTARLTITWRITF